MNGPEHYHEAERLTDIAASTQWENRGDRAAVLATAQVHATLALAPVAELAEVVKELALLRATVQTALAGAEPIGEHRDVVGDWAVNGHTIARLRNLIGGAS